MGSCSTRTLKSSWSNCFRGLQTGPKNCDHESKIRKQKIVLCTEDLKWIINFSIKFLSLNYVDANIADLNAQMYCKQCRKTTHSLYKWKIKNGLSWVLSWLCFQYITTTNKIWMRLGVAFQYTYLAHTTTYRYISTSGLKAQLFSCQDGNYHFIKNL